MALAASLALTSCSSSSSTSSTSSATTSSGASAAVDGSQAFGSTCSGIRSKYSGLPSSISVGTSNSEPPDAYANPKNPAQIIGLEPDMMAVVAACLGFKYTYVPAGFDNVIASVQSGRTPLGIEGVYVTPAREKVLDFVAYRVSEEEAVVRPSLVSKIHSVTDFCGLTTGVTTGSVELLYLQSVSAQCVKSGKPKITINVYQDIGTIFLSLASGRLDFSIGAAELAAPALKEYAGKIASSIVVPALTFDIGIAISKHDPELAQAVAAAVQGMQANNLETPILKKWDYLPTDQVTATLDT
ncbi:MAG TPA: transporter substrate-binding domain-containing protein [Streptosporangiaceae bacterium]|nr:transporter substrate-binding domain-containing protein [Streptosporangiaceae bacterium]